VAEFASATVKRVQDALQALGLGHEVVDLGLSARTAADAARAVGCSVAQICKSLVFRLGASSRPLLVVTSGANRVDEAKVGALVGEPLQKADADFVRATTGFAIGGVAPIGHTETPIIVIDEDLFRHAEIWAAAGTPNAVFRLSPDALAAMTGGRVIAVK
jgi:prolyl-tRNA editing enzyme YbaK/EbsC (Cys-tRNA(Pro) deacylase)